VCSSDLGVAVSVGFGVSVSVGVSVGVEVRLGVSVGEGVTVADGVGVGLMKKALTAVFDENSHADTTIRPISILTIQNPVTNRCSFLVDAGMARQSPGQRGAASPGRY
jgi:hypothetical protein